MKVIIVRMIRSRKRHKKNGQGLVEYAFVIGFIALILVAALRLIPQPVEQIFEQVANALGAPT